MPDDNDEILTMEILSVLRCEIKKVMGSGNGEVVIRIYNHKIRRKTRLDSWLAPWRG